MNEFMVTMLNGAKTLINNKTTKDILKYLSTVSLNYLSSKYNIGLYKYDANDMKNMVYHHNLNNNESINKEDVDKMIYLMNINRFTEELNKKNLVEQDAMTKLVQNLSKITSDAKLIETYDDIFGNNIIRQFDLDTLETSSIADSYEINSGGIYLPDKSVNIFTDEGCMLADAKNEYLERRIELGENASDYDVKNLIVEYNKKIDFDKVMEYFNN